MNPNEEYKSIPVYADRRQNLAARQTTYFYGTAVDDVMTSKFSQLRVWRFVNLQAMKRESYLPYWIALACIGPTI